MKRKDLLLTSIIVMFLIFAFIDRGQLPFWFIPVWFMLLIMCIIPIGMFEKYKWSTWWNKTIKIRKHD
jgi:hypothetical protein